MIKNEKLSLNICLQRNKDNKYIARCSKVLKYRENSEEEKSEVRFSKKEESKSNMGTIAQSIELLVNNKNYNKEFPSENQKKSYKELPHSTYDTSESPYDLMNNQQTPIKSNMSTNLSTYTTESEKVFVDVFDNNNESNYYEIAEKEKESKQLSM
jgi:hypothetical protein